MKELRIPREAVIEASSGSTVYKSSLSAIYTSSFACFACSATSPLLAYVSNLAPDVGRRTALCAELLLSDCVRFSCCSPIASASTATRRSRPLQLLLPDFILPPSAAAPRFCSLYLLLPDCVRFNCSSRSCLLRLLLALPDCICQLFQKILAHARRPMFFAEFEVQ